VNKLLLGVLLAGLCLPAGAETYKCVVNGKVSYTNQMPAADAKCEAVLGRKSKGGNIKIDTPAESGEEGGAAKKPVDTTAADKEQAAKKKKADAEEAKKKEEEKQAHQKLKEQNCVAAKANLAAMKLGRIRKIDEKGEPYYLSDAEIAQSQAEASKDVETWCN